MSGYSQASATANATVTILKPIGITKEADLSFAEVSTSATGGTVILSPSGSRTISGGVAFPTHPTQSAQAASFNIHGEDGAYTITLPEEILLSDGTKSVRVNNFTHSSTGTLKNSSETVFVGGTLNVNGMQEPGTYRNSDDLIVTVQYK